MEKLCQDCQYFEIKSIKGGKHIWGLCYKPKDGGFGQRPMKSDATFHWVKDICSDFKAKTLCLNEK